MSDRTNVLTTIIGAVTAVLGLVTAILVLQATQGGMDGAGGDVPIEAPLNVLEDRPPVPLVAQPDDGQENSLLERAENVGHAIATL